MRSSFFASLNKTSANLALPLLVSLSLLSHSLQACPYNVRDVGFVDLETKPYQLYAFLSPDAPTDAAALLQQMPAILLHDCNVQFELISSSNATNHPVLKQLPSETEDPIGRAILTSPDGQTLPLTLFRKDQPLRESLELVLEEIASSPKREELLTASSRAFAAILLIEGQEDAANQRARQAISRTIETVRRQMQSLPKPITHSPELVVLPTSTLTQERILLWSLGLSNAPTAEPRAAVVYGRARWIGPAMKGDEIAERNLAGLLSIIGADCECGLDVAWALGTRLPVHWDEARHAQAAKALAFDPENPLVKAEVSRIAARSSSLKTPSSTESPVVLSSGPQTAAADVPAHGTLEPRSSRAPRVRTATESAGSAGSGSVLTIAWLSAGVIGFVALLGSLFLLWARSRSRSW